MWKKKRHLYNNHKKCKTKLNSVHFYKKKNMASVLHLLHTTMFEVTYENYLIRAIVLSINNL